jgi:hypothetical protein
MEKSNAEKMMTFMGSPNKGIESVIEDKYMRACLIEAAMKLEKRLAKDATVMGRKIEFKSPWGLMVNVKMERLREDKPIIFTFAYRVDRVAFNEWAKEHAYLLDGHVMGFESKGLTVMIPGPGPEKYHKTSFTIIIRYADEDDVEATLDLLNQTIEFVVHREVVSEHDWLVKARL